MNGMALGLVELGSVLKLDSLSFRLRFVLTLLEFDGRVQPSEFPSPLVLPDRFAFLAGQERNAPRRMVVFESP